MLGTPLFAEFDATLPKLHTELHAREAHALYPAVLGDSIEAANAQIVFGY